MKKEIINKFGKKRYFLGIRKEDKKKVYLTEATWDCDWYWGFGYIETFSRNDVYDYQHFDNLFLKNNIFNGFKNYFEETSLTDDEIWILLGYMREFYVMKEYAEILQYGNHITSKAIGVLEEKNKEKNREEVERINKILIPDILNKIYKLLSE